MATLKNLGTFKQVSNLNYSWPFLFSSLTTIYAVSAPRCERFFDTFIDLAPTYSNKNRHKNT